MQASHPWWLRYSPFLCDEGPNTRSDTHHHTVIPGVLSKGGHPCRAFDTTRKVLKAFQRPVLWSVASLEVGSLWIPLEVQLGVQAVHARVVRWLMSVSQSHQMRSTIAPTSSSDSIFIQDNPLRDATKPKSNHLLLLTQYHSDN